MFIHGARATIQLLGTVTLALCSIAASISNDTLAFRHEQCTSSAAWVVPGLNRDHCLAATDMIYRDAQSAQSQVYEFLPRWLRPRYELPLVFTPRKYVFGEGVPLLPPPGTHSLQGLV